MIVTSLYAKQTTATLWGKGKCINSRSRRSRQASFLYLIDKHWIEGFRYVQNFVNSKEIVWKDAWFFNPIWRHATIYHIFRTEMFYLGLQFKMETAFIFDYGFIFKHMNVYQLIGVSTGPIGEIHHWTFAQFNCHYYEPCLCLCIHKNIDVDNRSIETYIFYDFYALITSR